MNIECIRYKAIGKNTFAGYADLRLVDFGVEIFGCTLHQKEGKRWVNMPCRACRDADSTDKYYPYIRFKEATVFKDFCESAKASIDLYLEQGNTCLLTETN